MQNKQLSSQKKNMQVGEIMSTPVVATRKATKIKHTREQLSRKNINALPVLEEDGTIAGILSSSDVAKVHDDESTVESAMSRMVHIVLKNNRVQDAAQIMLKHAVHHLAVMEDGQVVGMISSMDVIAALLTDDKQA